MAPYLNTPLSQVVSLDAGFVLTVVNALAAGGSGVANSQIFTVPPSPVGTGGLSLTLTAVPTGAVTTVTVDLEVSSDGGVTFQKKQVGIALIAVSVSTQAVVSNLQPGLLYRVNPITVTAGTSVTINATAD